MSQRNQSRKNFDNRWYINNDGSGQRQYSLLSSSCSSRGDPETHHSLHSYHKNRQDMNNHHHSRPHDQTQAHRAHQQTSRDSHIHYFSPQSNQSRKNFDNRWHNNDGSGQRQYSLLSTSCSSRGDQETHHSLHSYHKNHQDMNNHHHHSRSHDQTQAHRVHQQTSRDSHIHYFSPQSNLGQDRKRSLDIANSGFNEQRHDSKKLCTKVSNTQSSQMDKEFPHNQKGNSNQPAPCHFDSLGKPSKEHLLVGAGNKRRFPSLDGHEDSVARRIQSKKFKADYQQASTSHQSQTSTPSRTSSGFQNIKVKQTTFVEALPYPAEGVEAVYTKNPVDAETWLQSNIIDPSVTEIGLDIEWRPQFIPKKKGGKENKTAVIQLSVEDTCLVLHIFYMKQYPKSLSDVLLNRNVIKVGSGINGDVMKLLNDTGLLCDGRVDTQDYAKALGIQEGVGLKNLSKQVLGIEMNKPKSVSMSNWEFFPLRKTQIHYAALDSWVSLKLYLKLKEQLELENKRKMSQKTVEVHYGEPSSKGKKKTGMKLRQVVKGVLLVKSSESSASSLENPQAKEKPASGSSSQDNKLFKCPIIECCGSYENEQELQDHIKTRHVACKVCGKLYRTKVSVKHKKQHAKE